MLVFPTTSTLTRNGERVRQCLRRGTAIIATGDSGLNEDGTAFALQEWPAEYVSPSPHNPVYFQPEGELAAGLPELPMSFYADAALVRPAPGADVAMRIVRPYHNRDWDGLHANYYTPPDAVTEEPFLAIKGKIAYLAGKIFLGYYRRSPYQLRLLLGNLLRRFLPRPLLQAPTLPSFARVAVQKTPSGSLLVHLLAYAPELRGESVALEDRVTLADTEILLRLDGRQLTRVYLAPKRTPLPFTVADDVARRSCLSATPRHHRLRIIHQPDKQARPAASAAVKMLFDQLLHGFRVIFYSRPQSGVIVGAELAQGSVQHRRAEHAILLENCALRLQAIS